MEKSKNILGFIAAAVATLLLFICVCIIGVNANDGVTVVVRNYKLSRKSNLLDYQESHCSKPDMIY